jgi:hypothetical protein
MFGLSGKLASEFFILSGDSYRTSIQVTLSHHDAAHRNQRSSRKTELFGSEKRSNDNITTGLCKELQTSQKKWWHNPRQTDHVNSP